jgi:hypothetical protein
VTAVSAMSWRQGIVLAVVLVYFARDIVRIVKAGFKGVAAT